MLCAAHGSAPITLFLQGTLIGLDAEFIALSAGERFVKADGSAIEIKPPVLGLARLSLVRGQGPLAGVTLQDDFIVQLELVHD